MKNSSILLVFLVFTATTFLDQFTSGAEKAPHTPNFIVILSDDMGYSDLGCYGGEIQTPQLDSLASHGIRYTQFYNTARCCPTRASLLTGLYPHQAGIGHMMEDKGLPGYTGNLNSSCRTMAEVLKSGGYLNYAVGKWHVTRHTGAAGPKHNWPLQRGFDRYYGTIHGAGSFYDPSSLVRDNTMISPYADDEYQPETYYYTDAIADHAIRFVDEHSQQHAEKPFFMYVAFTAAHWPMHALPDDIAKYKGKYAQGYQAIREARRKKAIELGLISDKEPLSPAVGNWDEVKNKEWELACMEVYAAMIDRMDQGIGRLVERLKKNGQFDKTVIMYMQDNGGCAEAMGRTGNKNHPNILRPDSPTLPPMKATDFAAAGSTPNQTRDGYPVRMGPKVMPGPADTYIAYGKGWANVSNTPFREYKHWVHEGGISTPLVVHWPNGIKAQGELRHRPGHLVDIAATLYDLAKVPYPSEATPLEGVSLVPTFDQTVTDRKPIFWEHEGNRAVRFGIWKLVAKHNEPWELYDLSSDRCEEHNLANSQPEKLTELRKLYDEYAQRAHVVPWPLK
jgi:arylsulfatase A-like enzyme